MRVGVWHLPPTDDHLESEFPLPLLSLYESLSCSLQGGRRGEEGCVCVCVSV